MSDEQDVTLGEVYRLLVEVRDDVKRQNGRVRKLENQMLQIKTIWVGLTLIVGFFAENIRHKLGIS